MSAACIPCGQNKKSANQSTTQTMPDIHTQMVRPAPHYKPRIYVFRDNQDPPTTFEDPDLDTLLARIVRYRYENNLAPIPHLKELTLHYTMLSSDEHLPYREYYTTDQTVHISAAQYLKSALAFAKAATIYTDSTLFVPPEQAERRALICLNCPRNLKMVNGRTADNPNFAQAKFCQLKENSSTHRQTDYDNALGLCGLCTCKLSCKVHFSLSFIKEASTKQLLQQFKQEYVGLNGRPHKCWIGQELEAEAQETKQTKQNGSTNGTKEE